ncbi:MAG: 3-hydroxyacyl-CoA dehydrogenase [Geminicoccaceae bacterium]
MLEVAIVGTGLVGRAWTISFARAGHRCRLWDPTPGAAAAAIGTIAGLLADLAEQDLLGGQSVATVTARIVHADTLEAAVSGADWVQESAPEVVAVKRELWAKLDRLAGPDAILSSSTSAIVPSKFTDHLAGRQRCVVTHPINPPYLIPAVELVPAPWTAPEVMEKAAGILRGIGQAPIVMHRELAGFVMNRMQAALFAEARRLVDGGWCSVEDVDIGIRDGLALRWSFIGPYEVGDLNAPGGVREYFTKFRSVLEGLAREAEGPVDWDGPALDEIERQRRAKLPADRLAERQRWRDRRLMALAKHKRKAADEIGE